MQQPPLPLQDTWAFSFDEGAARGANQTDYEGSLRSLGSFDTVQGFWRYWNALADKVLPEGSNLRMFKEGITPSWEHPANAKGGRWVFVVPKEATKKIWTALILALIGDQFSFSEDVCGAVLSTRFSTDTINLWNRDATSQAEIDRCTGEILERLQVTSDSNVITEYKAHQHSLDSNRTFAKIASSSGRIKRRYSMNTLRTHSGTTAPSPRASPRLSTSDITPEEGTTGPSPPRSPRAPPPISRASSTPAVVLTPSPTSSRRSSPQPIHSPTLSPSTSRESPVSSPASASLLAPLPSTPPKQRNLSLSDDNRRHKRDRSREGKGEKKPSPAAPERKEDDNLRNSGEKKSPAPAVAEPKTAPVLVAKRAAATLPPPPIIAVSPPSSEPVMSVRITVSEPVLKPTRKTLSPILLCTYLVVVFSVLVGVGLVLLRPAAADAFLRGLL